MIYSNLFCQLKKVLKEDFNLLQRYINAIIFYFDSVWIVLLSDIQNVKIHLDVNVMCTQKNTYVKVYIF